MAIDQADVDQDYSYQGEFAGEVRIDGESRPLGLQVIALGKGKFKAVRFSGGLPGTGDDDPQRDEIGSEAVLNLKAASDPASEKEGSVCFTGDSGESWILTKDQISVTDSNGNRIGEFKRVQRTSPTLGQHPPANSKVLFDGTDVAHWKGGRLSDQGDLMEGTTSLDAMGSHHLHLEFLLPYMPDARGQARGNSGLYIQGRWEVQMLDSFGLEGEQNECGGLYSVAKPRVNMCLPPLTWQTYDIDFTAATYEGGKLKSQARVTVLHNGVKIHDDVELPNRKSTAAPVDVGPESGPIYLQDHGNPVRYRNIWIVEQRQSR